jgi:RNA methyltransferase, TrmH family
VGARRAPRRGGPALLTALEALDAGAAAGPLLALDPDGERFDPSTLPAGAVLAFGTERDGLSDELLARASGRVRIPMRAGVSSLNLATSVAATLFAWRLATPPGAPPGGRPPT